MKVLHLNGLEITNENQEIVYNALDVLQTFALKRLFDGGVVPDWAQTGVTYSEKMLGPVMAMVRRGVQIDVARRDQLVEVLDARRAKVIATFDKLCTELFGTTVNWNSTPQLKVLFYSFLGIPEQTRSKKGEVKVATDREVLERIAGSYPRGAVFANIILRIRDLEKQVEFLTKRLSVSNRFHTSYNIAGTETWRLSSSEHPLRIGSNQQNIPKEARQCFMADPDYVFFQADQQGAEARLVAYLTGDENYIAAVEGGDSHTMVASMVFGFPAERELAEREYYRGYSYRDITKKGAHGCLTADHEVLTPDGWASIAEKPSMIAVWDSSSTWRNSVYWAPPSNWLEKETADLISLEGPSISMLATPDHKMIVDQDGKLVERTAATLRKSDKIPYTGTYLGGTTHEPLAKLVAAYQADGNLTDKGYVRFKFRRPRKIERMRQLLAPYPDLWTEATYGKDTCFRLNASLSRQVARWGKIASVKLLNWDITSLREFANESILWDGSVGKTGRQAISSMSLEHVRWMQTIYQLCGFGSKVIDNTGKASDNFSGKRAHYVSRNARRFALVSRCRLERKTLEAPVKVYCPTVSTGYFLVRRNGHIYVSGNSNYYGKPFTLAQQMKVEVAVAEAFQAKYFKQFPGIAEWHAWVAKQLQTKGYLETPFGMRRTFWGRRWDDSTLREAIAFVPQHCVGVLTNLGLHKLWSKYEGRSKPLVQILMNGHDAVIGQIRKDAVSDVVPQLLEDLRMPFPVKDIKGRVREITIPFDMEMGYNWGKWSEANPGGLRKWKP
jgi:hypothetical protein